MKKTKAIAKSKAEVLSLAELTTRIVEREKRIDITCVTAVKHAMDAVQLAIDQGNDLSLARDCIGNASRGTHAKGDAGWMKWIEESYPKGHETARRYMALSNGVKSYHGRILQDMKSLREAFRFLGLLPEVENDTKQLPSISVSPIVSRLNFVAEWVMRSGDEIKNWEELRRQELKIQLKPVVELFEKL